MNVNEISSLSRQVGKQLSARGLRLVTAESCTGGWLAKSLTDIAGSSVWFECGFVPYSNAAKQEMLGVQADTLETFGAVSEKTVAEMAYGALSHGHGDLSVAISGVAGPDGGTPDKPVGTVCFAWVTPGESVHCQTQHFKGDREAVRRQSVCYALQGILNGVKD
ncbi:MAG: nicotinamide-nucleotide amidase [Gammaproteobacteria bacterium]